MFVIPAPAMLPQGPPRRGLNDRFVFTPPLNGAAFTEEGGVSLSARPRRFSAFQGAHGADCPDSLLQGRARPNCRQGGQFGARGSPKTTLVSRFAGDAPGLRPQFCCRRWGGEQTQNRLPRAQIVWQFVSCFLYKNRPAFAALACTMSCAGNGALRCAF